MSAPDTNIERQKRRHRGPLIGMALAVLAVGGMFLAYLYGAFGADEAAQPTVSDPAATTAPAD